MIDITTKEDAIIVGIIVIGIVLVVALVNNVDGAILGSGLAVIATLVGYMYGAVKKETGQTGTSKSNRRPLVAPSDIH